MTYTHSLSNSDPPKNHLLFSSVLGMTRPSGPARCSNQNSRTLRSTSGVRMSETQDMLSFDGVCPVVVVVERWRLQPVNALELNCRL